MGHPPAMMLLFRKLGAALFLATTFAFLANSECARANAPLHERIDQLLENAQPGGRAALESDLDFVRRAHLTLHGIIPTAEQARVFRADPSPDKRARLIDTLLGAGEFVHFMAVRFDVMLMERRGEGKHVKPPGWEQFLHESFAANKPWDALVRELWCVDGADERTRPIARWVLEREGDANALTREAGRLFLGRDMACAQCHDHPRIDDYAQRDYYGVQAFFTRTFLFRPDEAKPGFLGEKAEGEAAFTSVFTKVSGTARPRLPGGAEMTEPPIAPEQRWAVPPNDKDKNVRAVPTFSRRAQFGSVLASGTDPAFRKNIANRLWQMIFGRGLVEPVDLQHSANPPANPALLELLGEEIAALRFDMKAFVRELVLTRAFQRALDLPEPTLEIARAAAEHLPALEQEAQTLAEVAKVCEEAWVKARDATRKAQLAAAPLQAELQKQEAAVAAARKAVDAAKAEAQKVAAALTAKREAQTILVEAVGKAGAAAAKFPEAAELAAAAKAFQTKADAVANEVVALDKDVAAKQAAVVAAQGPLAAAEQTAATARGPVEEAARQIAGLQSALDSASSRKQLERVAARHAARLAAEAKAARAWALSPDATTRATLARLWSESFAAADLVSLLPEQLCWSVMQATGVLASQRAEAVAEWDKKNPLAEADKTDAAKQAARTAGIEKLLRDKLRPHENEFARLFGGAPSQPQTEFFATPEQALYFANAGPARGWSAVLAGRLAALADPRAIAEELYLSTFTRLPTDAEIAEIGGALASRPPEKKHEALTDAVWACLTSTEFRFNR